MSKEEPDLSDLRDSQLLRLFIEKQDEAAFARIVAQHGPMVLGVCRRVLGNHFDADDAFQATFLVLALKAAQVRQPELLGNWLFGVSTRTATSIRRANTRRIKQEEQIMRSIQENHRDPSDLDLQLTIDEQILRLPEKLRQVVVCCYLEGMTHREAAAKLRLPESTVSLRVQQAREALKRRLGSISDGLLATALIPVAVPPALIASSVKGAGVAASGQFLATHAITAKSFAIIEQLFRSVFVAKLKFGAGLLFGSLAAIALVSAAAIGLQENAGRPVAAAGPPATTKPSGQSSLSQIRKISLSVMMYAIKNGLPADLKTVGVSEPVDYFGSPGVKLTNLRHPQITVIVAERPAPGYDGPIAVGFLDGHAESIPLAIAKQRIEASKAAILAARAGATNLPAVQNEPAAKPTASQVSLPRQVRDALAQNAERLSPISISWTKTGGSPRGVDEAIAMTFVPKTFFQTQVGRTVWQDGKLYGSIKTADGVLHETAFDGLKYSFAHDGNDPQISTQYLSDLPKDGVWFTAEFFDRAGIHLPATVTELKDGKAASKILWMLDHGGVLRSVDHETLENQPVSRVAIQTDNPEHKQLQSLPAKRDYVFYLDEGMNFALRREEQRYGSQLLLRLDNNDFKKLGDRGIWMPYKATEHYYTYSTIPTKFFDEPILIETLSLTELLLEPRPENQLVLNTPVGARVFDRTQTASDDTQAIQPLSAAPAPKGIAAHWVIAVVALVIGALALFWWRRRSPQLFR